MNEIHFHTPSKSYRFGPASSSLETVPINRDQLQPIDKIRLLRALALGQAFKHGWVDAFQTAAREGVIDPESVSEQEIEAAQSAYGNKEDPFVLFGWEHTTATGRTQWEILVDGSVIVSIFRPSHEVRYLRKRVSDLIDIKGELSRIQQDARCYVTASEGLAMEYEEGHRPRDLEELDAEWNAEIRSRRDGLHIRLSDLDHQALIEGDYGATLTNLEELIEQLRTQERHAVERGDRVLVLRIVVSSQGVPGVLTWAGDAEARHYEAIRTVLQALDTDLKPGQIPPVVHEEMERIKKQGALERSIGEFFQRLALYLAGGTVKTENASFQALADEICAVLERYQVLEMRTMVPEVRSLWHCLNVVTPTLSHVGPHEIHTRTAMEAHQARLDVLRKREDLYLRGARLANRPSDVPEGARRRGGLRDPKYQQP